MNPFVINGLAKRRAELAGDIEKTHEASEKMVVCTENLSSGVVVVKSAKDGV